MRAHKPKAWKNRIDRPRGRTIRCSPLGRLVARDSADHLGMILHCSDNGGARSTEHTGTRTTDKSPTQSDWRTIGVCHSGSRVTACLEINSVNHSEVGD